jgi:hypothetical protein
MIWSFILAGIGVFGIYLAGKKNKIGWAVGFFAQILWVIYALVTKQYGFIASACAYGFIYGKNYLEWRRATRI